MHPCALLLDEVLARLASEEAALDVEDLDRAEEMAAGRAGLMTEAWKARGGYDEAVLRARLLDIQARHAGLVGKAEALHQKLREQQSASRKQTRYFNGDRHLHAQARKSFYCDKVS